MVHAQPNCFSQLLDQVRNLSAELSLVPQKWNTIWNKIEIPALKKDVADDLDNDIHRSLCHFSNNITHHVANHARAGSVVVTDGQSAANDLMCRPVKQKSHHHSEKLDKFSLGFLKLKL